MQKDHICSVVQANPTEMQTQEAHGRPVEVQDMKKGKEEQEMVKAMLSEARKPSPSLE